MKTWNIEFVRANKIKSPVVVKDEQDERNTPVTGCLLIGLNQR